MAHKDPIQVQLIEASKAYPEEQYPPVTEAELQAINRISPDLVMRIYADSLRAHSPIMTQAAMHIEFLNRRLDADRKKERDQKLK